MALRKLLSLIQNRKPGDKAFASWVKSVSGHKPRNINLYRQALSHKSHERNHKASLNNERLEFLGDAILGAIVGEYLFSLYPYKNEGFLTQLRSRIVNGTSLRDLARKLGFGLYLRTSERPKEKPSSSALGDAFEAFVGAHYLDQGYLKTKTFLVTRVIGMHLDLDKLVNTDEDYKSQLQIFCQRHKLQLEYRVLQEDLKKQRKYYTIQVFVNGEGYATFEHQSKRVAEQHAAELSLPQVKKTHGQAAHTQHQHERL